MEINYCIPSYKRAHILIRQTLPMLISYGVLKKNIYLFVNNDRESKDYKKLLGNEYNIISTNTTGIGNTRNFIRKYFPHSTHIIMVDDDIEKLYFCQCFEDASKNKFIDFTKTRFIEWIKMAFEKLKELKLTTFGIPLCANAFFLKPNFSTTLKYCSGNFLGIIIQQTEIEGILPAHGEDFESNILTYLRDGGILRFNNICMKTRPYLADGGIIGEYGSKRLRLDDEKKACEYLSDNYPEMCKSYKKSNGHYNIRFNHCFR